MGRAFAAQEQRAFFFVGIVAYAVSFLLPAFGKPPNIMPGYECFLTVTSGLLDFELSFGYFLGLFWNLSNAFVVMNVIWSFRGFPRRAWVLAALGIASACQWVPYFVIGAETPVSAFKAGYWLWVVSIMVMSVPLVMGIPGSKKVS